jgi:hypothetical protein
VDAEQALIAHLFEQLVRREDTGLLPLLCMRIDLGFNELGDRAHQLAVLFGVDHASAPGRFA